jgi:hypothetical protein
MIKKIIILGLMTFMIGGSLFAQKKPKGDDMPTQSEIDAMMKEAQQEMDNMDPEAKRLMDSLGFKVPDMKAIPKVTDAQLKQAYEDESRIVPKKDAARIATAQSVSVTNAAMSAYIIKTHQAVLLKLSVATKSKAAGIHQQIIKLKSSLANSAIGFWIDGNPTVALYLMGEACKADVTNVVKLNKPCVAPSNWHYLSLPISTNGTAGIAAYSTTLRRHGLASETLPKRRNMQTVQSASRRIILRPIWPNA